MFDVRKKRKRPRVELMMTNEGLYYCRKGGVLHFPSHEKSEKEEAFVISTFHEERADPCVARVFHLGGEEEESRDLRGKKNPSAKRETASLQAEQVEGKSRVAFSSVFSCGGRGKKKKKNNGGGGKEEKVIQTGERGRT